MVDPYSMSWWGQAPWLDADDAAGSTAQDATREIVSRAVGAAVANDVAELQNLVEQYGPEPIVYAADPHEPTPLFEAARCGASGAVAYLLEQGCLPAQVCCGSTPLIAAAQGNHCGTVELLAERGATVNDYDQFWRTALCYAARAARVPLTATLLAHGADPDKQNAAGKNLHDEIEELSLADESNRECLTRIAALLRFPQGPKLEQQEWIAREAMSAECFDGRNNILALRSQSFQELKNRERLEKVESVERACLAEMHIDASERAFRHETIACEAAERELLFPEDDGRSAVLNQESNEREMLENAAQKGRAGVAKKERMRAMWLEEELQEDRAKPAVEPAPARAKPSQAVAAQRVAGGCRRNCQDGNGAASGQNTGSWRDACRLSERGRVEPFVGMAHFIVDTEMRERIGIVGQRGTDMSGFRKHEHRQRKAVVGFLMQRAGVVQGECDARCAIERDRERGLKRMAVDREWLRRLPDLFRQESNEWEELEAVAAMNVLRMQGVSRASSCCDSPACASAECASPATSQASHGHRTNPLLDAVLGSDIERLNALLEGGYSCECRDGQGKNLLHHAAAHSLPEMARHLMSLGLSPCASAHQSAGRDTPVHIAARAGDIEVLRILLTDDRTAALLTSKDRRPIDRVECGSPVWELLRWKEKEIEMRRTPLHYALMERRVDDTQEITRASQLGQLTKRMRLTALHAAACSGWQKGIYDTWLCNGGIDVNAGDIDGRTAFHVAAACGQMQAAHALLATGARWDCVDRFCSCRKSPGEAVGLCRNSRCKGKRPRELAVDTEMRQLFDALEMLERDRAALEKGGGAAAVFRAQNFFPSGYPLHPIFHAAAYGSPETIQRLMRTNPPPDHQPVMEYCLCTRLTVPEVLQRFPLLFGVCATPLHVAIKLGRLDAVRALLDAGMEPHGSRYASEIAIELALGEGQIDIAQLLLEWGADPINRDSRGMTTLHRLAPQAKPEVLQLLLGNERVRQEINVLDQFTGSIALHGVAHTGNSQAVSLLVDAGADVDRQNQMGTPLHVAARAGHAATVQTLLNAGADPNIVWGAENKKPLDVAADAGVRHVLEPVTERVSSSMARRARRRAQKASQHVGGGGSAT